MSNNEQDYSKAIIFKIGILLIIVVVLFLWLASLHNVLESNSAANNEIWQKINKDVNDSLKNLDETVGSLASSTSENTFAEKLLDKASSTIVSTVPTTTTAALVKEELSDLIKKATTTVKNSCPSYINCMPTIGEARPCVIPVGCEDVTQIAY